MPVITLTTEWSNTDYYIGAVKGAVHSRLPSVVISDICHNIKTFNITQAAFIVKSCYRTFPKGSVHIICVSSEATPSNRHLAVSYDGHFFIGCDNGFFSLLINGKADAIRELPENGHNSFPELNVFAPAATAIIQNGFESAGIEKTGFNRQVAFLPTIDNSEEEIILTGSVIYIDSYDNAITNITKEMWDEVGNGRKFVIHPQSNYYSIKKINQSYHETENGELLAIFNSLGLLEIAIKNGSAMDLLKLNINSSIRIKFT